MTTPSTGARRLPIIGVMGSGTESHDDKAEAVGRWLATAGVHLLTGGGRGVMESVSRAFFETRKRRGMVLGVLPAGAGSSASTRRSGYPNPWVEIPLFTHLSLSGERGMEPMSRNHINVLSSNVLIALPGGAGTASEVRLAQAYRRPLVAFVDQAGQISGLPPEIAIRSTLEGVRSFIASHLESLGFWMP
jgi:uncharacterized protein (TIGR00725 family)